MYTAKGRLDANALLKQYSPLVRRLAHQMIAKLPANVELDDLIQVGMIGLSDALSRFDQTHGVQFETFATQRIRGAMLDELRGNDYLSRGTRKQQRSIESAVHKLEQKLGRAPAESEIAREMGLSLTEYQELLGKVRGTQLVYLEDMTGDEGDNDYLDRHVADEQAKQQALDAYRQAPSRSPQFAGRSYEADPAKLRAQINSFFVSKEGPEVKASEHKGKLIKALVAPTYEMKQAGPIYAWAYKELQDAQKPDLYVLIGTAHSGLEHPVAVTDKDFQTPLGLVKVDRAVTDRLREQIPAAFTDELAHHNEHALEFQLPFLQETLGQEQTCTIVPILTAFSADSLRDPQIREQVETFLQALKEALAATGKTVALVCSGDAQIYAMASLVFELIEPFASTKPAVPVSDNFDSMCKIQP